MILLALPLRDMLLARQVSTTCRALIEESSVLEEIRQAPMVAATLQLPFECSVSSAQRPMLHVDLLLHYDQPVTIRQVASPIAGPSSLTYRYPRDEPAPQTFPRFSLGAKFRARALCLSRENESKYITLLPGTPLRLTFDFGLSQMKPGLERFAPQNAGLNGLEIGRTYILGVKPKLALTAFVGTKTFLLVKVDEGASLRPYGFDVMYEGHIIQRGEVGKALPVVGEATIEFEVIE